MMNILALSAGMEARLQLMNWVLYMEIPELKGLVVRCGSYACLFFFFWTGSPVCIDVVVNLLFKFIGGNIFSGENENLNGNICFVCWILWCLLQTCPAGWKVISFHFQFFYFVLVQMFNLPSHLPNWNGKLLSKVKWRST